MSKKKARRRRTLAERAESIFRFIDAQPEPFPKSELQRIGLNPTTAESWVRLIEYIQMQPMIKVTRMGSSTFIEKIENKYLSMMRKRILNPKLSLKERNDAMRDYVNALMTLETIEINKLKQLLAVGDYPLHITFKLKRRSYNKVMVSSIANVVVVLRNGDQIEKVFSTDCIISRLSIKAPKFMIEYLNASRKELEQRFYNECIVFEVSAIIVERALKIEHDGGFEQQEQYFFALLEATMNYLALPDDKKALELVHLGRTVHPEIMKVIK